jgi:hypothetical protein
MFKTSVQNLCPKPLKRFGWNFSLWLSNIIGTGPIALESEDLPFYRVMPLLWLLCQLKCSPLLWKFLKDIFIKLGILAYNYKR